jgi:hypothetical protein
MLGSAIPRRWIISLALVGLVTVFAVSYAAVWSSPASADSQGPGNGNGNGTPLAADETLNSAETLPIGLTMEPGQQVAVSVELLDLNGDVNNDLPGVTFSWSDTGGSGSVILGATDQRTAIIQANSAGSTTFEVYVYQNQESGDWRVYREIVVTVSNAAATATAAPMPTNPGTPPASIPNAGGVVTPEGALLLSPDGVESGSSPESSALNSKPVVDIQVGSVNNFFGASVASVDPSSLPAMPSMYKIGSKAASISFYDVNGVSQDPFTLLRAAKVCLPTSSSDRANGITNVKLLRYNAAVGQWVALSSTYNAITNQVCGSTSHFSNFAVGVQQLPATPVSGNNLPATGGWSPTSGMLSLIGVLGFLLVGGGFVTMRRAKQAARPE